MFVRENVMSLPRAWELVLSKCQGKMLPNGHFDLCSARLDSQDGISDPCHCGTVPSFGCSGLISSALTET